MRNRWVNALIKTLILLIAVHVVLLIIGYFTGPDRGVFNLPMIWAHWSDGYLDATTGIISTIVLYFIIYILFTGRNRERMD